MLLIKSMLRMVVTLFVFLTITTCDDSFDPCDDTKKPEIAVSIRTTVHIRDRNDNPIPNEFINFEISKTACGFAISKGNFTYQGNTDEFGNWTSSVIGYNLRNSEDVVNIYALAPYLDYFEKNYEALEYKYDDFSTLSTKQVHLYIYSKNQN